MYGHINLNIDINEFKNLDYKSATIDKTFHSDYIQAGHNKDQMILYNYFEPNPMPSVVDTVREYFSFLSPLSIAVNLCKPGQYLPLHSDMYKKWMEVFEVKDITRIHRYIVMLEDSTPGQLIQIENDIYSHWRSGNYISWAGDTPHAIYNMSTVDRYALQITGYQG